MNGESAIWIVEDYENDTLWLKLALKRAGVVNPVVVFRDGVEAVSCFKGEGVYEDREKYPLPSILFLDLKLPRMDGFEVLQSLRKQPRFRSMLIFVVSGDWEGRGFDRTYQLGAHSFLVKPCTPAAIANLIKAFPGDWMISSPPVPKQDTVFS
jgi:CheY-like chemotaxis protein